MNIFGWGEGGRDSRLNNGRSLRQNKPNLVIQTDESNTSWELFCNKGSTVESLSEKEENLYINILELIAEKF